MPQNVTEYTVDKTAPCKNYKLETSYFDKKCTAYARTSVT